MGTVMAPHRRSKSQQLNQILEAHEGWERRTLADLRTAGFDFTTIDRAKRYREAELTLARMNQDEIVEFVAAKTTTKRAG